MPISPDYYPPFDPLELPASPSQRMTTALDSLYRASVEIHRTLYRLALLHEISRSAEFTRRVNNTPLAHPMLTIRGSLAYTVAISLYAVFDVKDTSASLRRVLRTLVDRREEPSIRQLHAGTGIDVDRALARLGRLQKRMNSGYVQGAVTRLKDLRDQQLAHFDIAPTFGQGLVLMGDIDRIFTFAANVVNSATLVAVRRLLKTRESYEDARKQARDLTSTLIRASAPTTER